MIDLLESVICDLQGFQSHRLVFEVLESIKEDYQTALAEFVPDIALYCLDRYSGDELEMLSSLPKALRAQSLLMVHSGEIAPFLNLRLAMQAGAVDVIPLPEDTQGLLNALTRIHREMRAQAQSGAEVTLVLSVTGGGGSSTFSGALAGVFSQDLQRNTLLVDLDLQFGTQYSAHDLKPEKGLKEALDHLSGLDPIALKAYIAQHQLGFDLIGVLPDQLCLDEDIENDRLQNFIELVAEEYEEVVIDLPCHIGSILGHALVPATRIVLMVHQSLSSIQNTMKLIHILVSDFEQPLERIGYVINKFSPDSMIKAEDIEKALGVRCFGQIPIDVVAVDGANGLGLPLRLHAPKSKVTLAINEVSRAIGGYSNEEFHPPSWFTRLLRRWSHG